MSNTANRLTAMKVAKVISYLVYFWVLTSLVILVLGFFLKLFNANPDAGFSEWAYRNLDRVMEPFRGMFPAAPVGESGSVFDTSIVFAMIVYGIAGLALNALTEWLSAQVRRLQFVRSSAPYAPPPVDPSRRGTDPGVGTAPGTVPGSHVS